MNEKRVYLFIWGVGASLFSIFRYCDRKTTKCPSSGKSGSGEKVAQEKDKREEL